ncbi:GTP-binding protein [uncultured Muriicola sp.]|uniref:GTP-binding protein n=1 Tax=uncultured Muriicola sp. TaxID=1583102 RepID=UPI00262BEB84|nr:GTP-binding protein [uncultured Muriicola sp.]
MKPIPNEIVLRPRFQLEQAADKEQLLSKFEQTKRPPYIIKRMDDHVFIKFNKQEVHFWSPQLQLEIIEKEEGGSRLYGLFGPNPTLWTFFMFLHFGVGTFFIIFGIWAYSSAALNKPYGWLLGIMGFMVVLWFVLYAFGRAGKKKGKPQMEALYSFMEEMLAKG